MNQSAQQLQRSEWHRATSLTERLAILRAHAGIASDAEVAAQHMRLWRGQSPFTVDGQFARRLGTDGTTEDEFQRLLGITAETLHVHGATPTWLTTLAASYAGASLNGAIPELPQALSGHRLSGFLNAVAPLVNTGCGRLRRGVQALSASASHCPFEPTAVEPLLLGCLPGALLRILGRTLVLELNSARLNRELEGTSPEERFASFVAGLRQPATALRLLLQYPVLARQAVLCVDNWVASSLEFLRHLCEDWPLVRDVFAGGRDPGPLEAVEGNLGDRHRGGRSVLRAKFASGCEVVYKPRSLAVDVHFQELLAWLNDRGNHPAFHTLRILDRGTHGWVEFVRRTSCTSEAEVRRFFERQGGYLAVLYALEATDFHHENLIAAGEHPVLLDVEALFHPRVNGPAGGPATPSASDALTHSVMRVGLLPERVWSTDAGDGIDISGIGAAGGQLSPDAVPQWENFGTDTMRFTRKRVPIPGGVNRPTLDGVEVEALGYVDAIATGFTRTYELLLEHRAELVACKGPLTRFADDEVRVLIRPTRIYAKFLEESFHPDLLRDALTRERFVDRLWVGIEDAPHLALTIRAEREDLNNLDIPVFTTRPGSRDLWTSRGERIADALPESALTSVRRRMARLSPHDLEMQRWFIKASLSTLSTGRYHASTPDLKRPGSRGSADATKLVAAARVIGERLESSALRSDEGVSWIGLTSHGDHRWSVTPLNSDLYGGLPGVALFFGYLGAITREDRFRALARAALSTALRQAGGDAAPMQSVGAFTGWGGLIYVLSQLAALWGDSDLVDEAATIVRILPRLIANDEAFDIVDGAAGCIGSLLALHACAPDSHALAVATACGDRLVSCARPMPHGAGWMPEKVSAPLAGFAHGAAGIAWALLHLAAATGEERFRTMARSAIAYERSVFSPEAGNWLDLRPLSTGAETNTDGRRSFMTAWCHGAAGIGLARLHTQRYFDDGAVGEEIEIALRTTAAHGLGGSHCLCHGGLGNLDLLLQASRTHRDARWTTLVEETAADALQDIETCGYACGSPAGVETPGLMTGLAGIGYGLLRLAHPDAVPSVLVLEPHARVKKESN